MHSRTGTLPGGGVIAEERAGRGVVQRQRADPAQRARTQARRTGNRHHDRRGLDPYTSHGQDGILDSEGYVLNDRTVET